MVNQTCNIAKGVIRRPDSDPLILLAYHKEMHPQADNPDYAVCLPKIEKYQICMSNSKLSDHFQNKCMGLLKEMEDCMSEVRKQKAQENRLAAEKKKREEKALNKELELYWWEE